MTDHDPDFDAPEKLKLGKGGRRPDSEAAFSSHVWGVIALFGWWAPLVGQMAVAAGLVRGYQGWTSPHRVNARIGVAFSLIALGLMIWIFGWIVSVSSRAPSTRSRASVSGPGFALGRV